MSTGTERDSQRPAKRQKGQDDRKKSPPPPDFKLSGQLAKEANNHNGIALKYCEPLESRKPTEKYRFHIFKGKDQVDILQLFNQSAYLLGRDRKVADIPIDHPSCSKQHAALQYRQSISTDEFGGTVKAIKYTCSNAGRTLLTWNLQMGRL